MVKLALFAELPKVNYAKTSNFAKWAQSFSLVLGWKHSPRALVFSTCPYLIFVIFLFLFELI